MKKVKLTKKLQLNKETIAKLNENQMTNIQGGTMSRWTICLGDCAVTCVPTCYGTSIVECPEPTADCGVTTNC
jgi:hypothetical protein